MQIEYQHNLPNTLRNFGKAIVRVPMQRRSRDLMTTKHRWILHILYVLSVPAGAAAFCRGFDALSHYDATKTIFFGGTSCQLLAVERNVDSGGAGLVGDSLPSPKSATLKISNVFVRNFEQMKQDVKVLQQRNDYAGAWEIIEKMIRELEMISTESNKVALCEVVDSTIQSYLNIAFASPYRGRYNQIRISSGMKVLDLQLSSTGSFDPPYNSVPKRTLLSAIKAMSSLKTYKPSGEGKFRSYNPADAAYRLLQRLVTGVGIRHVNIKSHRVQERDFAMVMNAYASSGRMDMAQRVMTLQEQTKHAPPLSAVTYSILLKGYGRLRDEKSLKATLEHAKQNEIAPDTIMLNSLIDAYVNCNQLDKARNVFDLMRHGPPSELSSHGNELKLLITTNAIKDDFPVPNKRTYNTILKGLANNAELDLAIAHSDTMKKMGFWDDVTTNTLVQAAVTSKNFTYAETLLQVNTAVQPSAPTSVGSNRHPNVEAYTNLLDGYAKAGQMKKALDTLRLMEERGVTPNEVTYTCMIGALAQQKKLRAAHRMMSFMRSKGLRPSTVTYNSFISGLVSDITSREITADGNELVEEDDVRMLSFDAYVDESIVLIREMVKENVWPNSVTVSVIVEALGRCARPRVEEAKAVVAKLEEAEVVAANNTKILTALIHVCSVGGDLQGALDAFRRIAKPDVAAVNAFLDACIRCCRLKIATDTFAYYFRKSPDRKERVQSRNRQRLEPDVISYTILISGLLENTIDSTGSDHCLQLYQEMKTCEKMVVDKALVDAVLKAMVKRVREGIRLQSADIRLTILVLRDALTLDWEGGQLERRKRAIKNVFNGRIDSFREQAILNRLLAPDDEQDELFKRHGWNKVNSGFRFFDTYDESVSGRSSKGDDEFLRSKGWNNVDSGFRII